MKTMLELKCRKSLSKLGAYMFFFLKSCRHQRHLAFSSYSPSKEELDAEALFCSWPQEAEPYLIHAPWCLHHWNWGKTRRSRSFLKTWLFISSAAELLSLFGYFWPAGKNNKATWKELPLQRYSCAPLPQIGLRAMGMWSSLLCREASTVVLVLPTARTSPLQRTEIGVLPWHCLSAQWDFYTRGS